MTKWGQWLQNTPKVNLAYADNGSWLSVAGHTGGRVAALIDFVRTRVTGEESHGDSSTVEL